MKIVHAACTDTGLIRPANEDYFRVLPEIGLYILADGMGGARGGGYASKLAADTVAQIIAAAESPDASTLMAAVEEAHGRVRREASLNPSLSGMGTTVVAALVKAAENSQAEVAIVSVGDSRAYRFGEGELHLLTEDQTWVREVGIPLGLSPSALKTHPMRHALTMAVGIDSDLEVRYYGTTLKPGFGVLLSSDGLHGLAAEERIAAIVCGRHMSLKQRCEDLIHVAKESGGTDNITAVLLEAE